MLYAFDAAGSTNCSVTSNECSPLWKAGLGSAPSAPAVANGVVYIGAFGGPLYAFDAAGNTGCTTGPGRVCAPLWRAPTGGVSQNSSPAVANGVVYIGGGGSRSVGFLLAFDATGTTNCSGAPKTCAPVWTSDNLFAPIASSPAVSKGYVYVGGSSFIGTLAAFHFG
jgi:outer membrane protein assembly factor BamB